MTPDGLNARDCELVLLAIEMERRGIPWRELMQERDPELYKYASAFVEGCLPLHVENVRRNGGRVLFG